MNLLKLLLTIRKRWLPGFVRIAEGPNKGLNFFVVGDTNIEYVTGEYETALGQLLAREIQDGDVVMDIGAHHGYYTLAFSRLVGPTGFVYSFEPLASNYRNLTRNVIKNDLGNVSTFEMAISDKIGEVPFSDSSNTYANTLEQGSTVFSGSETTVVSCIDLDTFSSDYRVAKVDFLKIDVEGHELEVLHGAAATIRRYKPTVYLATHDNHKAGISKECLAFMLEMNYTKTMEIARDSEESMVDYLLHCEGK